MPYRPTDEDIAANKKRYYAKHPETSPQSTWSRVLEFFGQDEPFAPDRRSYDYRQKAWDESVADGNPDVSWMVPALNDEQVAAADDFLGDLPDAMKGTREREGDARIGWMPHVLDQFNYTPWDTAHIMSVLGPDSPESVQRDIDAWKGGSSSLDRMINEAVGVDPELTGDPTQNPLVDPIEWGSLGAAAGAPGMLWRGGKATVRGAKAGAKGAKKVGGLISRAARTVRKSVKPGDVPLKSLPKPKWPTGTAMPSPYTEKAAGGSVRNDIARAMRQQQVKTTAARGNDAAIAAGFVPASAATGGLVYATQKDRPRRKRGD